MTRALEVLATVPDPEIPALSVVDLGIVREVVESADGATIEVTLTPTYSGCPATEVIAAEVEAALGAVYDEVRVLTRLSPAWTTDWLTEAGRAKLMEFGIAPPNGATTPPNGAAMESNGRALLPLLATHADAPAACPHCGSPAVEELAGFGSTPCKALWRCLACREPFDYFKVH